MVSNMEIRQQELVHGENQTCDVAGCMKSSLCSHLGQVQGGSV